jgi:uncharacterized protein (DUF924 family)
MTETANPMVDAIREVLDFWFAPSSKAHWFEPSEGFDRTVAGHLGELHRRAASGNLKSWQVCAEGCLALCILLDQAPRQLYRGEARAFATDAFALGIATEALARGFDRALPAEQRLFLYLPLMHSESLPDQERCVTLFGAEELRDHLHHAVQHAKVIRRFNRFPHRNAALGRASTVEEEAWLREDGAQFGHTTPPEAKSNASRASCESSGPGR